MATTTVPDVGTQTSQAAVVLGNAGTQTSQAAMSPAYDSSKALGFNVTQQQSYDIARALQSPYFWLTHGFEIKKKALRWTTAFIIICWTIIIGVSAIYISNLNIPQNEKDPIVSKEFLQLGWYVGSAIIAFVIYSAIYEWKALQWRRVHRNMYGIVRTQLGKTM